MKIEKMSELEMLKRFPVKSEVPGWYFRVTETSNSAWLVEGMDQWGRLVSATGNEPGQLLLELAAHAREISQSIE